MGGVNDTADRDGFATDLPARLQRVHMIGIGGAGMSGIARILLARGGQVSGSDAKESRAVIDLRARGAQIRIGHDAAALDALPGGPTAVISTLSAIPKDNPELLAAADRDIPVLLRPAVLAELLAERRAVLIAGTHGKTSTTSMTVVALQHCRADPSFVIGRAHLPLSVVAHTVAVPASARQAALGRQLDPEAFVAQHGWIRPLVLIVLDDPDDPTPYWLLATRNPEQVLAAIGSTRAEQIDQPPAA